MATRRPQSAKAGPVHRREGAKAKNMTLGESKGDSSHEPTVRSDIHTPEGKWVGEEARTPLGNDSNQTHHTNEEVQQDVSWRRTPNTGEEGIMEGYGRPNVYRTDEPSFNSTPDEPIAARTSPHQKPHGGGTAARPKTVPKYIGMVSLYRRKTEPWY